MPYHHVIAKLVSEDKFRCLFSDLSVLELRQNFVAPYEGGKSFFVGNDLISPLDLRSIQIVCTESPDQIERDEINRVSRERINEINRSSGIFIVSIGGGYAPQDIAHAGEDVTHTFIKGPPGFKAGQLAHSVKVLKWIGGIIAAVIAAGIAKWLDWV
ncbi:MAG: hypothetical protein HGA87_02330 [Desulfobulbaceae bacterium]|nr:hypothetical protein [Desulfobulbaceae bacterium]